MPHPGEQSALLDDRGHHAISGGGTGGQELQGDLAIQPRIPRPVDVSECSAADTLDDPEMTPVLTGVGNSGLRA
jgi:hypothetical protein